MKRKIIKIDSEKCNGCTLCVKACHEGAIGMTNGKAVLLCDDYCDGLGDCLPVCPTGAITFIEREALAYDEAAVENAKKKAATPDSSDKQTLACGCPGSTSKRIVHGDTVENLHTPSAAAVSRLSQWPVQIKLVPVSAPYFAGANLLIAADCCAFAYGNFHEEFIKNHITLIGCPKLDMVEYAEKLTAIIRNNNIKSLKVVRMEVPCCGGIEHAAIIALKNSGKFIPWQVFTITTDGQLAD